MIEEFGSNEISEMLQKDVKRILFFGFHLFFSIIILNCYM